MNPNPALGGLEFLDGLAAQAFVEVFDHGVVPRLPLCDKAKLFASLAFFISCAPTRRRANLCVFQVFVFTRRVLRTNYT
jgi:hypothetical protein